MQVEREEQMSLHRTLNPASTLFIRVRNVTEIFNVSLFSLFHSCGGKFFLDNVELGLAMKPQLDLRTERAICRGHLSDRGALLQTRRGLTAWSGGSTNAFIIILTMSVVINDALGLLLGADPPFGDENDEDFQGYTCRLTRWWERQEGKNFGDNIMVISRWKTDV